MRRRVTGAALSHRGVADATAGDRDHHPRDAGDGAAAMRHARRAAECARDHPTAFARSVAHNALGAAHRAAGRYRQAVRDHDRALALADDCTNWRSGAPTRIGLAHAYRRLGELDRAERHAREALAGTRKTGLLVHQSETLTALAAVAAARGDTTGRDRYAQQALDIQRATGNRASEIRLRAVLGWR